VDALVVSALTVFGSPREMLVSEYGRITYGEWCALEVERFKRLGRYARVVKDSSGRVAVTRLRKGGETIGTKADPTGQQGSGEDSGA
jgi:hypothetical protein